MDIHERNAGENIAEFDEDTETFANSSLPTAASSFDTIIGRIEDIIMEESFQQLQQTFMEKHYLEFEESEENKLSYTIVFNEYVAVVERHLEQQLTERILHFNMNTFLAQLMQHKEKMPEDIFDMLVTFTDFMAFKEMFLEYRADKEGRGLDLSQGLVVTPLIPAGAKQTGFKELQRPTNITCQMFV
ncbi:LOW QUALITY PROTEIN: ADP-ribosylation factor-like protein 2-binding protein [Brachionichthys hirsutus]|uniref:LOW QUALITY PROTEIN: ADP-ribosylation factor-like protein 2-binding protein n=1 Tax=Brachionichthys hirsutus TaxID=412623 RepID=UPI003604AE42